MSGKNNQLKVVVCSRKSQRLLSVCRRKNANARLTRRWLKERGVSSIGGSELVVQLFRAAEAVILEAAALHFFRREQVAPIED